MKTILSKAILCLTLLLAAVSTQAANEDVQPQNLLPPRSETTIEREPRITRDQASVIARATIPGGRVVSARLDNQNWRIRVDLDGRVSDVLVDAESGQVSRPGGE